MLIYGRLEAMKWSIPYVAGGLADQDPMLLRGFDLINRVKASHEAAENKKREREMGAKSKAPRSRGRVAGRR